MHKRRAATTTAGARAVAERITSLRKARGITQVELAKTLQLSQASVSQYESGEVLIHAELLAKFAQLFRVTSDELLGIETKRSRKPSPQIITPDVDKGLARRFAQLQALSRKDKETISRTIDALIAAHGAGKAA